MDLVIHFGIIDLDALKLGIEDIPDLTDGTTLLLIHERGGCGMLNLGDGVIPCFEQYLELSVKLSGFFVLGRCANNDAEVLGLHALNESAQAGLLGVVLDLLGDRNAVVKRSEHHESSSEGDFGGQAGTFGRDGFFSNLHQQLLPLGKHITHCAVLIGLGLVLDLADACGPLVGMFSYRLDVLRKSVEL